MEILTPIIQFLYIILSLFCVLFLPGYATSLVLFPRAKIDSIERIALSVALSIATVPLLAFYANLLGVRITQLSVTIEVILFILLMMGIYYFRKRTHSV